MIRIAITGPESSGKTTLSQHLGEHYQCDVIPEFARLYLEQRSNTYTVADLDLIAQGQVNAWKQSAKSMICDTEMTVIKIWSEVKFGTLSPTIEKLYQEQHFDYYFLCQPDIPWEPDPLREHPEERDWLFELYIRELQKMDRSFTVLSGIPEERLKKCVEVIQSLFPFFKK